ncbi:hypothetical protein [Agarivorans sp. QJM3NY_25]|uniref:hypothetical protein n=1 Tax=Agarivorans sp. QJM3NY_25 TaxID=3421430 RepID=UPI003D7C7E9A
MKECPIIIDLKLDENSLKAIEEIKQIYNLKKIGRYALFMGHIYSIFGGSVKRGASSSGVSTVMNAIPNGTAKEVLNGAGKVVISEANQTSYNIYMANWEYFYQSFDAFDKIAQERIEFIAFNQGQAHISKPKEYKFWKAIYLGCKYNAK